MLSHNRPIAYAFLLPLLLTGCGSPTAPPVSPSASPTSSPTVTLTCPEPGKAPTPTSYQQRDGNRCEGLEPGNVSAAGAQLKSLIVGNLPQDWSGDSIALLVPEAKPSDRIELEFPSSGYLIDRFATGFGPDGLRFAQPTTWLKKAQASGVEPADLTARAEQEIQNQPVYLPVILGQPRDRTYQFKIKLGNSVLIKRQEIRRQGQNTPLQRIPGPTVEITPDQLLEHTWTPQAADPAGTYALVITPVSGDPMQFDFQYDPAWFQ
jgi:hypothetical protein